MDVHRERRDQPYLMKFFHLACVETFLLNEASFLSRPNGFLASLHFNVCL